MALKNTWANGDTFAHTDANAVADAVNTLTAIVFTAVDGGTPASAGAGTIDGGTP